VILIRHTRPDVAANVCYGRTDLDVAASFDNDAQAVVASVPDTDVLVSSPLKRCKQLAQRVGTTLGLDIHIDPRIQEMDFGSWEGIPWSDIARDELDEWANDFLHARPHGGESVAMLQERVLQAIDEYRETNQRYIIITHSGVIKAALADGDTSENWSAEAAFGEIVHLT
jgi:alpha-ribazole phosphatase